MNAMNDKHLTVETLLDGKRVDIESIHDPFIRTKVHIQLSIFERLELMFTGQMLVEVRVRGDKEAHRQWFRTDPLPGSHHDQKTQASSVQDAATKQRPGTVCPTSDGSGTPTAVAIAISTTTMGDIVLRIKPPQEVDRLIQMLLRHKRDVWPEST